MIRKPLLEGRRGPGIIARLVKARRLGMPFIHAAKFSGVHRGTAYRWIEEGRQRMAAAPDPDALVGCLVLDDDGQPVSPPRIEGDPYVAFARASEHGEALFVAANLAVLERAAQSGAWQAAAWRLERSMPDLFGRRTVDVRADVKVTNVEADVRAAAQRLTDAELGIEPNDGTNEPTG